MSIDLGVLVMPIESGVAAGFEVGLFELLLETSLLFKVSFLLSPPPADFRFGVTTVLAFSLMLIETLALLLLILPTRTLNMKKSAPT
jgi:hypothetical protein